MTHGSFKVDDGNLEGALDALRSDDVLTQNEGVAEVIRIGATAVPELLSLLEESGIGHSQVMYALAQIGDPRADRAFIAGLEDDDKQVRAYAALGMVRTGHPDAMAASLQTLNYGADILHADMTPSVESLGEMGLKAVPSLLESLMDDDEMTRLHAQRALELILARRHGYQSGQGFPSAEAEERMRAEWQGNGDYDYISGVVKRGDAVAKWRQWLIDAAE